MTSGPEPSSPVPIRAMGRIYRLLCARFGLPVATNELVVVMCDHDAPGGDFIHWGIAHIDPELVGSRRARSMFLPVAAKPPGAVLGLNSFGSLGYRGPGPPPGSVAHRYEITVYARPAIDVEDWILDQRCHDDTCARDRTPQWRLRPSLKHRSVVQSLLKASMDATTIRADGVMSQVGHADSRTTLEIYAQVQKRGGDHGLDIPPGGG